MKSFLIIVLGLFMNPFLLNSQDLTLDNSSGKEYKIYLSVGDTIPFRYQGEYLTDSGRFTFDRIDGESTIYAFILFMPAERNRCILLLHLDDNPQYVKFDSCKNGEIHIVDSKISEFNQKNLKINAQLKPLYDSIEVYVDKNAVKFNEYNQKIYSSLLDLIKSDPSNPLLISKLLVLLDQMPLEFIKSKMSELSGISKTTKGNQFNSIFTKELNRLKSKT